MKKVCVISTGGTIGMKETPSGLRPEPGFIRSQISQMPELSQPMMPALDLVEYEPVIDSSNMRPSDWGKLARDIERRYFDYDGFVVLHGTDTMAYTASALPLILGPIAKPIILTGSQLPLAQVRSDARENFTTAVLLAANYQLPEVCVLFGDLLLRGCRTTKLSAESFDAFESPNFAPLGRIGATIDIDDTLLQPAAPAGQRPALHKIEAQNIATFRLFPGMSNQVLKRILQAPLQALILESYGPGNGPNNDPEFLETIAAANQAGIVLVSCSQCKHAHVTQPDQAEYETGRVLLDAGVISGFDMTIEAAITKLQFLFSNYNSVNEIKQNIIRNFAGELTTG